MAHSYQHWAAVVFSLIITLKITLKVIFFLMLLHR